MISCCAQYFLKATENLHNTARNWRSNQCWYFAAINAVTRLSRIQAYDVPTPTIFTVIQAMAQ